MRSLLRIHVAYSQFCERGMRLSSRPRRYRSRYRRRSRAASQPKSESGRLSDSAAILLVVAVIGWMSGGGSVVVFSCVGLVTVAILALIAKVVRASLGRTRSTTAPPSVDRPSPAKNPVTTSTHVPMRTLKFDDLTGAKLRKRGWPTVPELDATDGTSPKASSSHAEPVRQPRIQNDALYELRPRGLVDVSNLPDGSTVRLELKAKDNLHATSIDLEVDGVRHQLTWNRSIRHAVINKESRKVVELFRVSRREGGTLQLSIANSQSRSESVSVFESIPMSFTVFVYERGDVQSIAGTMRLENGRLQVELDAHGNP